jgi:hypothetical protein
MTAEEGKKRKEAEPSGSRKFKNLSIKALTIRSVVYPASPAVNHRKRTRCPTLLERKRRSSGQLIGDCCQVDVGEYTLLSSGSEPSHWMWIFIHVRSILLVSTLSIQKNKTALPTFVPPVFFGLSRWSFMRFRRLFVRPIYRTIFVKVVNT